MSLQTSGIPCQGSGSRQVVCETRHFTQRIIDKSKDRYLVILDVEFEVVSDYLFIGSGLKKLTKCNDIKLSCCSNEVPVMIDLFTSYDNGLLIIPGSTVKGVVRSRLELGTWCDDGSDCRCIGRFTIDGPPSVAGNVSIRRHKEIWCESLSENRSVSRDDLEAVKYTVIEDLFGVVPKEQGRPALASRVLFSDFKMVLPKGSHNISNMLKYLCVCGSDGSGCDQVIETVGRGTIFRGSIVGFNITFDELGLILYGLGYDKYLCGRCPLLLMGRFKYYCPVIENGSRRKVLFGIVKVKINDISIYNFEGGLREEDGKCTELNVCIKEALEEAFAKYPALRRPPECFDEVERRLQLEPECSLGEVKC